MVVNPLIPNKSCQTTFAKSLFGLGTGNWSIMKVIFEPYLFSALIWTKTFHILHQHLVYFRAIYFSKSQRPIDCVPWSNKSSINVKAHLTSTQILKSWKRLIWQLLGNDNIYVIHVHVLNKFLSLFCVNFMGCCISTQPICFRLHESRFLYCQKQIYTNDAKVALFLHTNIKWCVV